MEQIFMQALDTEKNEMNDGVEFSRMEKVYTHKLAKMIVANCAVETSLNRLRMGDRVLSKTGDFSDVKIVTPFGESPWNNACRITSDEIKNFDQDFLNKVYTFLLYYLKSGTAGARLKNPQSLRAAKIDKRIQSFWDSAKKPKEIK